MRVIDAAVPMALPEVACFAHLRNSETIEAKAEMSTDGQTYETVKVGNRGGDANGAVMHNQRTLMLSTLCTLSALLLITN